VKHFLYFTYYRLYQWSAKREENFPMMIVLAWLTVISFFHVCTILSLITIVWRVDAGRVFSVRTNDLMTIAWLVAWAFIIWLLLRIGNVNERAFSQAMVAKYKEKGFRDRWIVIYFVASFIAMAGSTWVAGAVLRSA